MSPNYEVRETKWHGARYHVAASRLLYTAKQSNEIHEWCEQNFGEVGDTWTGRCERYYIKHENICFRNEEDLTLFLLKWA